ncbi:hypothetical protein ASZ78_015896 [Callipepla squamata]|uniref:Immunoglobulin-like and fibronectin type III domain-containing protein 1 n=1 Tax=Callipepla squamata TaxID=9009 RepID=A0A226NHT9_CALSU|nr:hypothetical protein ASZ78_015896 [Callipepla squamata]
MATRPAVKSVKKSTIRGVHITQFVDKIPKGCSTPDFERKPVSLTLQEGKNAIFRAAVKGVPAPEVKWKRAKGNMDDPAKYVMFYSAATSEHILQINKITAGDSDLYRCTAVNEYGEAACSAGLRIIQDLKKNLQDLKKTLKKRAPPPKQKVVDREAIFQLLLHADKKDYEKICIKYGISDFRGMLRRLQEMRRDAESEQAELIHSVKNMEHIKVNKDGSASFTLEMELKNANSNVYLLKDGEKVRYGTGDEYRKYCLRQIGKRYHFIINDVHPEDAGLYQVRVEDVPVFSTELDAESIPVRFQKPLRDTRCHEEEDAVFECILRTPCFDAVWLHKAHPLEASEKHQISVSPDGLTHQLIVKNAVTSDNGLYTLDTGICSSRAWLLVEHARGTKDGESEKENYDLQKEALPNKDRAKKPKRGEYLGDEDHPMDAGMKRDGWYRSDHEGSQGFSTHADEEFKFLGKEGLRKTNRDGMMGPGQFSGEGDADSMMDDASNAGLKMLEGKSGLRPVHSQDSMSGRADTDDGLGGGTKYSVDGRHDSMLGAADVDMGDAEDKLYGMQAGVGGASLEAGAGAGVAAAGDLGGAGSPYGKDGLPAGAGIGGAGEGGFGGVGYPYGKDGLAVGMGPDAAGVAGGVGSPYGKDGLPVGAGGVGSPYGKDDLPVGAGLAGAGLAGAGGVGSPLGKDGLPVGAGGKEVMGSHHGQDAMLGRAQGAGRLGDDGRELDSVYGKEGVIGAVGMGGEYGRDSRAGKSAYGQESTEKRRHHRLDDLKAPRCRVNKQLIDVRVLKGEPTELSCAVNRHDLTGTWFKDGLKLTSMDGVSLEKEGLVHKLIISKVEDIHAGKYRFEAGDIKTEASIFVEDPPQVDGVLLTNLMSVPTVAKAGEKVVIKIPFEGRLPVRATWLKDKIELGDDSRIRVDKTDTFTMLSISSAERKDCGDYKVRLKNDSGLLDIDLKVEVIDKPQPPAGPMKIVGSSANDVTIQWNPPKDDGGKPVQNYIIEKQQVGKSDWVALGETPRSCTTFTTNKVEQDKSYYFRVRAVNAEGTSDALESSDVVTISKASPGAPDAPEIIGVSKDTITISWKAPRKSGSSRITGYIVQKRKKGTMTWVPVNSTPIADKKLKITSLKKGLQYEFCVAAVNASGMGDVSAPSQAVFARDSTKPPGQVKDLKATISDSTSVTLTWNKPEAKEGSDVKGYDVEIRSSSNLSWTKCNIFPIETTTYKIKGLQTKEMYFLRVRALNDCGPGEAAELEACIDAVPPVVSPRFIIDKTVKNFLVIKAGNAIRVNIPFEAPPDCVLTWLKDGVPLPSHAKINTQDGSSQLLIKAAEFTDSGIYTVELMSGTGKRETFSFQVQVTDIPQPPGPIELRENVPNIVTVTWEPSTSEKWENNLFYTVLKRESQKGVWHVVGDLIYTNKFTYTNVIAGRDYYFRVVAKNHLGSSGPSDTVQPWRIRKPKADIQVRPHRYRGVNQNQPPRFLVPLKPHVVTTGSECRMSCAVGGHPPPKITWYKDGRDLTNNPSYFGTNDFGVCSLVILGVSKADEGDYTVEATNESGRAFSRASLTIKDSCL